ncbi:autotransporter domain-containing protein [Propionivibrio sp.]|uniref:autotransporter domain-containing protein n=1 Tax=Propionivibrio sp. TaxID=2212460 RepID=UPI003BF0D625
MPVFYFLWGYLIMSNKFMRYLAGAAILTISGVASAQTSPSSPSTSTCASPLSSYAYYVGIGDIAQAQYIVSNHPQCFGGSVTSQATINASTIAQSSAISNSLSNRLLSSSGPTQVASNGVTGMAAGAQLDKWNVWGNLTFNNTKVDYTNAGNGITKNSNDIVTPIIGADYAISSTMVIGISAAFDDGDGTGRTNNNASNSISTSGYLIAPYFGMQLSKELALDASVGFGNGKLNVDDSIKSEADRLFGALNLSYNQWFQNIQLTGKLGYLHAEEDYGNSKTNGTVNLYTKNKNKLDQFRAGVQVGYWMNGVMPYAGITFTTDDRSSSNITVDEIGKNATLCTLGVNFFDLPNKATGGIAYSQEFGRTNSKNDSLMANINVRF